MTDTEQIPEVIQPVPEQQPEAAEQQPEAAEKKLVFMTRDPNKGGLGIASANVPADEVSNWEAAGWEKAAE